MDKAPDFYARVDAKGRAQDHLVLLLTVGWCFLVLGISPCPLCCKFVVVRTVVGVFVCNTSHQGILRVAVSQQGADGQEHFADVVYPGAKLYLRVIMLLGQRSFTGASFTSILPQRLHALSVVGTGSREGT
eukprot:scaffold1943_cov343-Pavlova_lutheri.AAC.5